MLRRSTNSLARLVQVLEMILQRAQIRSGVETLTVSLANLTPASGQQLELFGLANRMEQEKRLQELLPDLVARYGPSCFYRPVLTDQWPHLPERRFQLQQLAETL